jgi:uncharacterized protein YjgD (DUF1641 family)
MTYKKTEKEILKALVKYGEKESSMAKVLNMSQLLEERGIVIAFSSGRNYIFCDKQKYDWDDAKSLSYIAELISLIKHLIENRLITILPKNVREIHVLGRQKGKPYRPGYTEVDDAFLEVDSNMGNWIDKETQQQTYWPSCYAENQLPISTYLECWFSISQELRDLVENDFKTEEQIRFDKQQRLTWISIGVAALLGLLGIIF